MTLLSILSLLFVWLIYRALTGPAYSPNRFDTFNITYISILISLVVLTAWLPVKYWRLESFLADKASELAEFKPVSFHCNSLFDSIFDNAINVIGHANPDTGEIVFQYEWCSNIIEYLDHPNSVTMDELMSLSLFTHEAMHIRGQLNEQKTECEAIQRNFSAAKLLGVSEYAARKNAIAYYQEIYPRHPYFTPKCAPGEEYDEGLPNAVWDI